MINILLNQIEREERDKSRNLARIISNATFNGIVSYPIFTLLDSIFYNQSLLYSFQDKKAAYMATGTAVGKLAINLYKRYRK
jgi:hypothetical protein